MIVFTLLYAILLRCVVLLGVECLGLKSVQKNLHSASILCEYKYSYGLLKSVRT